MNENTLKNIDFLKIFCRKLSENLDYSAIIYYNNLKVQVILPVLRKNN